MFVHLVLIKLKPGVTRADPRVPAWQAKFAALEHKCSGIVRFERRITLFPTRVLSAAGTFPNPVKYRWRTGEFCFWMSFPNSARVSSK